MTAEHEQLRKSVGVLKYNQSRSTGTYWLVVEIDPEITRYYRALIPKSIRSNKQMYAPHITVVREAKETPVNLEHWGKYQGEEVEFEYSHEVQFSENYVWLNVWCQRLEEIRLELGMPVDSPFTRPPDGYAKTFHTTLGNFKELLQQKAVR